MWWVTTQKNGASALGCNECWGAEELRDGLDVAA